MSNWSLARAVRCSWIRVAVVATILATFDLYAASHLSEARAGAARALQGAAVLFTVCTAVAVAMLNTHVVGLRAASVKMVSDVRNLVERAYDAAFKAGTSEMRMVASDFLAPLMARTTREWLAFDDDNALSENVENALMAVCRADSVFYDRYMIRLVDEINQLQLLYVRRIVSGLHVQNVSGVFLLVCFGIVAITLANLLPAGDVANGVVINASLAAVSLGVIEILHLLTYVRQGALDEAVGSEGSGAEE